MTYWLQNIAVLGYSSKVCDLPMRTLSSQGEAHSLEKPSSDDARAVQGSSAATTRVLSSVHCDLDSSLLQVVALPASNSWARTHTRLLEPSKGG